MNKLTSYTTKDGWQDYESQLTVGDWKAVLEAIVEEHAEWVQHLQFFYQAKGHTSSCFEVARRWHNDARSVSACIMQTGRFAMEWKGGFRVTAADADCICYWLIPMTGKKGPDGHFLFRMRPELVQALEEMRMTEVAHLTWIPFFTELANKLVAYKDRTDELMHWIYDVLDPQYSKFLMRKDGEKKVRLETTDPFTMFGILNRGLRLSNRRAIAKSMKDFLGLESEVPMDFDSVPVLNNMKASFTWYDEEHLNQDSRNIWDLLDVVVHGGDMESMYNRVRTQHGVAANLTMALYWIRPYDYLGLDSRNREYLAKRGIKVRFDSGNAPAYTDYCDLMQQVRDKMKSGMIPAKDFPEFSYQAWIESSSVENDYADKWQKIIAQFKVYLKEKGGLNQELYKWQFITDAQAVTNPIEYMDIMGRKDFNLIEFPHDYATLKALRNSQPEQLAQLFQEVCTSEVDLSAKVSLWRDGMDALVEGKTNPHNERTLSCLLTCYDPQQYTFYKWEVYEALCGFLGIPTKPTYEAYPHFLQLMGQLVEAMQQDEPLMRQCKEETKNYTWSGLLMAQTIAWGTCDWMKNQTNDMSKIWMAGYAFGSHNSQLERFLKDGIWEGGFDEKKRDDQRQLKDALTIQVGDLIALKATYTRGSKHEISVMGIKAVGVITGEATKSLTEDGYTRISFPVDYKSQELKEFTPTTCWKTLQPLKNSLEVETYIRSCVKGQSLFQAYIELLKENHNLVLTGAPGTGKTYMARQIAEAMGAEVQFVQFHPSYDYTDFVEGLRPVQQDAVMGFERRDGIFKAFCKRALQNQLEARKSAETLAAEMSVQERLDNFLSDAVDDGQEFSLKSGTTFSISSFDDQRIRVQTSNEKTSEVTISYPEVYDLLVNNIPLEKVHDIRNHYERKFGTQQDSYEFTLCQEIRKRKAPKTVAADRVQEKPYVMIIDEINRGELSKIFGELFFAIDPGYRGEQGRVQTQYQNLVESADLFSKGFFVPSNVYLLGTMNDIDRSVESMDFAMRRRFTWEEIQPATRLGMWEGTAWAAEAQERMTRLNEAICQIEGLGAAFQIGPAYFLRLNDNGADFAALWQRNLLPLLREYLRGFRRVGEHLQSLQKAYEGTQEEVVDVE